MPLIETKGAASAQGFGLTLGGAEPVYIEQIFSTYLYTGNGSTQTITNGIDLAGKGGLVWTKVRNQTFNNILADTVRGGNNVLYSDSSLSNQAYGSGIYDSFGATGYTLGSRNEVNGAYNYVSWTFRKQPKFFDVVTYTGNGANRTIAHALGSVPGCIIVKRTNTTGNWQVYHNGLTSAAYSIQLNLTNAQASATTVWNSTAPTSSVFSVGTDATVNASGGTYVAYLFAHNAGGFGLTGTDNVISCGSFTTDGSGNATVNLGYEPQLVIIKTTGVASNWAIFDTMRGMPASGSDNRLFPNLSAAEDTGFGGIAPTATGFNGLGLSGSGLGASLNYIYIAIRRGPMKVPTDATKVFKPLVRTGTGAAANITGVGFPPDIFLGGQRNNFYSCFVDRLRGYPLEVFPYSTLAEQTATSGTDVTGFLQDGISVGTNSLSLLNGSGSSVINYFFQRAPSFSDQVCYTGNAVYGRAVAHNLGAVPEMLWVKNRPDSGDSWAVYHKDLGLSKYLYLNSTNAAATSSSYWSATPFTTTTFSVGNIGMTNANGNGLLAYLFASCPGVSKVGSYTGTGSTQTINCGFTGGARFVLIKRTDSTGDWYVWDTARGMVSGTDPSLLLNSTAAEVNANSIYTTTGGFQIVSTAADINASGGSYIYLAIA